MGEIRLPFVNNVTGTAAMQVFLNCTGITAIHFAAANEALVKTSPGYLDDPTLGTGTASCIFDL